MKPSLMKVLQPHLIAIGLFLLISILYFTPALTGKSLDQGDIRQWLGSVKEITDYREEFGKEPLWTSTMFSGMPAYQISVVYASNLIQYVNKILILGLPSPINLLFLSMIAFYFLMMAIRTDFKIGIAGAIAYAFCSFQFVSLHAGHNTKVQAIAVMPLVFAGVLMAYRERWFLGVALTALALSLQIYANHLQITYYTAITVGLLVLFEFVRALIEKKIPAFIRSSVFLLIALVLAVLPNLTNLLLTYEYGQYSTRSQSELSEKKVSTGLDKDYALGWSYGRLETMTLLIPGFAGGSSAYELDNKSETYKAISSQAGDAQARSFVRQAPVYWGDQPGTSGPVYNGAIPVFLFILSLFLLTGPLRLWIATGTLLFMMLSWGKHFMPLTNLFFDFFPGYNKFRSVSMALVIPSFLIPLAGMLGLSKFTEGSLNKDKMKKFLQYSFYIAGGLCLIFVVLPGLFCDFSGESDEQLKQYDWLLTALRQDRENMLRMDALRSLFFISIAFGMLYAWMKDKLKLSLVLPAMALLILIDMWAVDKRFLNDSHFTSKSKVEQPFTMTAADQQILQDTGYYRVMNTAVSTFNDASTSYFHHSIGGYHGAKLKRYQELIEYQISKGNMNVLNMLNAKYFIVRNPQDQSPMVQMNPGALGAAWVVSDWKIVANADEEMKALDSLDTRNVAVIDTRYSAAISDAVKGIDSSASVRILTKNGKVLPDYLAYEIQGSKNNLVLFSEIYYPVGWNAYLDGKQVSYIRANYALRGLQVPAGKHKVEFRFEPEAFITGEKISLAGSVLLLLLVAGAAYIEFRKK